MKNTIIKRSLRIGKITLSLCFLALLYHSCISSYIGYHGYEKWKYRRSTFGDKAAAIERKVFIKDLKYSSSIKLDSFQVYIEKGYWWGFHSMEETRFETSSKYPFQVSFTDGVGLNDINYYLIQNRKLDSIDNMTLYLESPSLKDTLLIGIHKFNTTKWDSIGYVKVWDAGKNSTN